MKHEGRRQESLHDEEVNGQVSTSRQAVQAELRGRATMETLRLGTARYVLTDFFNFFDFFAASVYF